MPRERTISGGYTRLMSWCGLVEEESRTRGVEAIGRCCALSIFAMFVNGRGVLIFVEISFPRCAICAWMYMRKVRDVQRPCFMIVVSSRPCIFMAIAPPARREWTPTRSASMPCFSRPISLMTFFKVVRISVDVMVFHCPSSASTSQIRLSSLPPLDRM